MAQDQRSDNLPDGRQRLGRFLALNIRAKIILPYLILTLVVAVIGVYVVTTLVAGSLDERLTNQLLEAGRVVSDSLARREISHLESARMVAFTQGLPEALDARDRDSVARLAQPVAAGLEIECLIIVDADGRDVLQAFKQKDGTFKSVDSQFNTLGLWMVQGLLKAGNPDAPPKRGIGLHPINQRNYYFTAVPVGLKNKVVGVVIVGTLLDTLVPYFRDTSVADVIIYLDGGRAVATTLAFPVEPTGKAALDELSISPDLYEKILLDPKSTTGENVQLRGRAYRLARNPLRVGDDAVGVFAVILPSNFVIQTYATSRNTYTLLFFIATVSVILIGYLVSQRITRPIHRLVRTSQAVAEGDLKQRTGIQGADEIGRLASTFDEMTGRLADRTRALEKLLHDYKEAASRMKAILSSIGDGVVLGGAKGDFVPMNAAAQSILADMEAAYQLSPLLELPVGESDRTWGAEANPWLLERRRFKAGKKVVSAHAAAVRTDDGELLGTVIVLRDVTAEVEAERLKDAFVAHVSHELRTPLTAIKGYSGLLLADPSQPLDERQRDFLQTISHHTDNLIGMINALLDFSEVEAKGHLGVQRRPSQLSDLVKEVADEWRPQIDEKGLAFEVDIPAHLPPVNADVKRLRWAIINLVRNAWQYTPPGGKVTLRLSSHDGQVSLDVIDTGVGISPEDQSQVFERFYRAPDPLNDEVRGIGLGLYVTKAIVEAHGGEIHVVSQEGAGSTFSMILPALQDAPGEKGAADNTVAGSK